MSDSSPPLPQPQPQPQPPSDVDVAVIGGGIAGLVAATRLIEAGLRCAVLERHDRVGGRLLTHHSPTGSFDLGATWYWPGESRVAALIDELHVPTHAHHLAGDAMYHVPGGAQRLDGNPIDVTSGRFTQGSAGLAERLAERLGDAIALRTAVHRIDHHDSGVTVSHTHGSSTARHVVVAVPPSLAVDAIEFRPSLPEHLVALAAATPVWMGNIVKAVVVYRHAFWQSDGLSGSAVSHIGPLREIHDMSGVDFDPAALFGFAPLGPHAQAPTEQDIIDQLTEIFGPEAASPLEVVIKDWRTDAHHLRPGTPQLTPSETYAHRHFQQPTGGGRIHWASTETAPISPGHIEGAIVAAERAVAAITVDGRSPDHAAGGSKG
ncbi:MAG: FAD-dependent oxidoreductase [Ilumatobacteraceae bacterium]